MGVTLALACQQPDAQEHAVQEPEEPMVLSTEERLANVQSDLKMVKADLTNNGKYNCCVQPACDWCLLHEGNCACYDNLKAKKEVCPGCGLGWHNGKGVVQGVKASQVKWNITHEHPAEGTHRH
jgi:hypothetical protein